MPTQNSSIEEAYAYCVALTNRRESNFALGFKLLSPEKINAVYVVYAVCRYLDDISDELKGQDISMLLDLWKRALDDIYDRGHSDHPIGIGLIDVLKTFKIPKEGFLDLIEGCKQDQLKSTYTTFKELEGYCDLVATSIAKVSLPIYGFDDYAKAFGPARDLSIAFQLTNIMRDVAEDYQRERIYLPAEDLKRFDLKLEDIVAKRHPDRILKFYEFQAERCDAYFKRGLEVLKYVDTSSHRCIRVMSATYNHLLTKVKQDPLRSLDTQVALSREDKRHILEQYGA